jgi:hypothetical protein
MYIYEHTFFFYIGALRRREKGMAKAEEDKKKRNGLGLNFISIQGIENLIEIYIS